ncbi:hypothetical protein [Methanococcus voltae]|uniref:Uncharacterized protein n=1 Tax=Methanococcus voltae (strain ATCC BAA-1334 / A3) TaxID=456320 RepID=D7DV96_METV3|nr:hypothetical protein [Methanococcus voltae]MCS3901901.1 hypothetical protein [Methanococcus voltae]
MKLIKNYPKTYDTGDLWIQPTNQSTILNYDNCFEFNYINKTPIIRILGSPSVSKMINNLLNAISKKFAYGKYDVNHMNNIFEYINKEYRINGKYNRAKIGWYKVIGDTFNDLKKNNFEKVLFKLNTLLKSIKPLIVIDTNNTYAWNYNHSFKRFVNWLNNDFSIIIRTPFKNIKNIKQHFSNSKINNCAALINYAKNFGILIKNCKVAERILNISHGNITAIEIILKNSKRELKTLRDLKIPWKKVAYQIIPTNLKKLYEKCMQLKKFKIQDIYESYDEFTKPTLYRYLSELCNMGILSKNKTKKTITFKVLINKLLFNQKIHYKNYIKLYEELYLKKTFYQDMI